MKVASGWGGCPFSQGSTQGFGRGLAVHGLCHPAKVHRGRRSRGRERMDGARLEVVYPTGTMSTGFRQAQPPAQRKALGECGGQRTLSPRPNTAGQADSRTGTDGRRAGGRWFTLRVRCRQAQPIGFGVGDAKRSALGGCGGEKG